MSLAARLSGRPTRVAAGSAGRRGASTLRTSARRGAVPRSLSVVVGLLVLVPACSGTSVAGDDTGLQPVVGDWRGVLLSQGGELPFALRVNPEGSDPPAAVSNGGVEQPLVSVMRQGAASYILRFVGAADSEIVAKMSPDGQRLSGYWRREDETGGDGGDRAGGQATQMPFTATKSDRRRFQRNDPTLAIASPEGIAALPDLNGTWEFKLPIDAADTTVAGEIVQQEEHVVADLFGRTMEGIYRNGLLRLSMFDGSASVLLHLRAGPDGTLAGDRWTADQPATQVTASRLEAAR